MNVPRRGVFGAALATTAVLLIAGCTDKPRENPNTGGNQAASRTYVVITHQAPGDSFWDVVKKGAEQAGKDMGVKVEYEASGGDAARQADLVKAAADRKVDGIVVSMASPKGIESAVKAAMTAGIPVVTINGGSKESKAWGALGNVGQEERIAGNGAGEKLAQAGVKNLLCIIHENNDSLRERCDGAKETLGGTVTVLNVNGKDPAKAQSDIQAKLTQDKSIDGILALNPDIGVATVDAAKAAGSSAKIATFDLNPKVLQAVMDGKLLFAIDQQQYLQGYLPIVMLKLYNDNLNTVGGGQPVLTGPGFVTKDNAAKVADRAKAGTR
jgi:simple sugar transport system substrate-binding protein